MASNVSIGRSTRQNTAVPEICPGNKSCIFCGKYEIRNLKKNTLQKTSQMLTENAESRLREAASIRNDAKLLIAIQSETSLIAREVHYHKLCYANYTRRSSLDRQEGPATSQRTELAVAEESHSVSAPDDVARCGLVQYVNSHVMEGSCSTTMTALTRVYTNALRSATSSSTGTNGNSSSSSASMESVSNIKVKRILVDEFNDKLTFCRPSHPRLSAVVCATVNMPRILADFHYSFQEDLSDDSDDDCDGDSNNPVSATSSTARPSVDTNIVKTDELRLVYHAARILRNKCFEQCEDAAKVSVSGDCLASARDCTASVPDLVFNFLIWLICNAHREDVSHGKLPVDESLCRAATSLGQDIVFQVTNWIPPKHIVLGVTLHHLYRSKKLLTILNRYGHTIAYSQVLEAETMLAERKMRDGVCVDEMPSCVVKSQPFFHVIDNNDLNEETRDGKGTMHCTNSIVVQPQISTSLQHRVPPPTLPPPTIQATKRKRSLSVLPEVIPDFAGVANVNPKSFAPLLDADLLPSNLESSQGTLTDFVWMLARCCSGGDPSQVYTAPSNRTQTVPAWTAFNALALKDHVPGRSKVGYCPVVNSSPTDVSTVYAILRKCMDRCSSVGLGFTVVVMDQAIYAKAVDIIAQRPLEFESLIPRMGAFHISCVFLAIIGKRFRDAGLYDILVESGVAGSAVASAALDGKQYNRAVRFHKLVAEGLERLRWQEFIQAASDGHPEQPFHLLQSTLQDLQLCISGSNLDMIMASPAFRELHQRYRTFCQEKSANLPNFRFWSSYLSMVHLLLQFIRSSRTGNWSLHLACIRNVLPWCFAYDHVNYARFLSYYWVQMRSLRSTHPDVSQYLADGGFSVQRSDCAFAQVAADLAIEQSINRATKTQGGVIGISRSPAAIQRWVLTAHDRGTIADACLEHCGLDNNAEMTNHLHKECQSSRMVADENDVIAICSTVSSLVNPFVVDEKAYEKLVSLSSCTEASEAAMADLLRAEEVGEESFCKFVHERLTCDPPTTAFHDPLKKLKLSTFTVKKKTSTGQGTKKASDLRILQADHSLFSRIALIAQTRQMDLREVLTYPLGSLPWALAMHNGSITKTNKAVMLHRLAKENPPDTAASTTATSALIIDAMAFIRLVKQSDIPATYAEFAQYVLDRVSHNFTSYGRIDFVVDTYRSVSIKNIERGRRSCAQGVLRQHIANPTQQTPKQFSKYLSVGDNKEELITFLFQQWQQPNAYAKIPPGKQLFTTSGQQCAELTSTSATSIPDLLCSHEEADTRLVLHAQHAAAHGYDVVTVKSPDTDVAVIACALSHRIPATILFRTGSRSKTQLLNLTGIGQKLGEEVCSALPGVHAVTGCDSVSTFVGIGKRSAFEIILKSPGARSAMAGLGQSFQSIPQEVLDGVEQFVCTLYKAPQCTSINQARYELFCTKSLQSNQLPPCQDALRKHIARANYQAAVWRCSLSAAPEVPEPQGNGKQLNLN